MAGAAAPRQPERAARLFGAAHGLLAAIGAALSVSNQIDYERNLAAVRAQLGDAAFEAAWTEGQAMSFEAAVAEARRVAESVQESGVR